MLVHEYVKRMLFRGKSTKVRGTGMKENNEAETSKDRAPLKVTLALTREFTA